jgi:hypothetical protein
VASKNKKSSGQEAWARLDDTLSTTAPQLYSVLRDEEDFISLRLLLRDDRTVLAVLKKYGSDGGKLVCFGSGYGVSGALIAVNSTIAANAWKVDKPYKVSGSQ